MNMPIYRKYTPLFFYLACFLEFLPSTDNVPLYLLIKGATFAFYLFLGHSLLSTFSKKKENSFCNLLITLLVIFKIIVFIFTPFIEYQIDSYIALLSPSVTMTIFDKILSFIIFGSYELIDGLMISIILIILNFRLYRHKIIHSKYALIGSMALLILGFTDNLIDYPVFLIYIHAILQYSQLAYYGYLFFNKKSL